MSQPISQGAWKRVSGTAAGSTVLSDSPTSLNTVTIGQNFTGTATFFDSSTVAGTSATNQMIVFNNNTGSIPVTVTPNVSTTKGLVVFLGGTTDILVGIS